MKNTMVLKLEYKLTVDSVERLFKIFCPGLTRKVRHRIIKRN